MNLLQKRIMEASQKYYSGEESGISDAEFDGMLNQLKKENPNDPLVSAVGHGYDVNSDSTKGRKVKHPYGIVQSLDKCHNWAEINKDLKIADEIIASIKLDGLSCVMYYVNGVMSMALTRGSNGVGIDITEKVRMIQPKYEIVGDNFTGAIRGEILMPYSEYDIYQEIHPEAKNARNSAAGLINSDSSDELGYLRIVVYTVIASENIKFSKYQDMHNWLVANFRYVAESAKVNSFDADRLAWSMELLKHEWYNEYPADGIVLTENIIHTTPTGPVIYNAQAYKFEDETAVTHVTSIKWELSKTKYLIPVVEFDTVELEGTSVERASGFNAKAIQDMKIGIGSEIRVRKANQIIPHIEDVLSKAEYSLPDKCPFCSSTLKWEGVHLACPNSDCGDSKIQDTLVWMNMLAPVEGLGNNLRIKFLTQYLGDNISIEAIYEHGPILTSSELIQEKKFIDSFNRLFNGPFKMRDAIKALNILRFGDVTADKLSCNTEFITLAANATADSIPNKPDELGDADYASLCSHINKFNRLKYILHNIDTTNEQGDLKGKVAITGKLSIARSVFEDQLRSAGYQPVSTITKDVVFLITDSPNSNTTKNKKADELGVTKITEFEFRSEYLDTMF